MYGRFAWGLRGFLRHPITLEEAKAIVQRRMAEREENFLRLVRKGIFGYPKSPYLPLLKLAQCEMGDIENMVEAEGLEKTLRALREAGVYVTFEEFKGREPIVRNGQGHSMWKHMILTILISVITTRGKRVGRLAREQGFQLTSIILLLKPRMSW